MKTLYPSEDGVSPATVLDLLCHVSHGTAAQEVEVGASKSVKAEFFKALVRFQGILTLLRVRENAQSLAKQYGYGRKERHHGGYPQWIFCISLFCWLKDRRADLIAGRRNGRPRSIDWTILGVQKFKLVNHRQKKYHQRCQHQTH